MGGRGNGGFRTAFGVRMPGVLLPVLHVCLW